MNERLRVGLGFTALVLLTSWTYGLLTGSPPFGVVVLWEGWTRCLEAGSLPCTSTGYPVGVSPTLATTLIYGAWFLTRTGMSVGAALDLLGIASIAAGLAGLWYLGARLSGRQLGGALAGVLYFASSVVIGHLQLYQLFLGFALLPVPLALAVLFLDLRDRRRWRAVILAGVVVTGLLLVYLDPYPWVVATALAVPIAVVALGRTAIERRWRDGLAFVALLAALLVSGLIFYLAAPVGELEAKMPEDFYRAMGVDLGVALVPTSASELGDLTWGADPWRGDEFAGDGSQIGTSYLGIPLLVSAIAGAVVLVRHRRDRMVLAGLALGGAACLVLSFGPSLKVVDRDSTPREGIIEFGDYLMPASDATVRFPWAPIFEHQPIASMRATYRWQVGARVAVTLLASVAVVALARRRTALAVAVGLVLILDASNTRLRDERETAEGRQAELDHFVADMDAAYGAGRLVPGDRVLFLPAANDYLAQYIASTFDVKAYNLGFDKAIAVVRPQQPPAVIAAMRDFGSGQLTGDALCDLFRDDLVDAVAFNDFSLRWDSYRWPPSPEALERQRAAVESSGVLDRPGIDVDRGELAVIAQPTPDGPCDGRAP